MSFSPGTLSRRDRRALTLGLAVLLPFFLWMFALRPYRDALADARDRLASERALLQREEALVAAAPTLPAALESGSSAGPVAKNRTEIRGELQA